MNTYLVGIGLKGYELAGKLWIVADHKKEA